MYICTSHSDLILPCPTPTTRRQRRRGEQRKRNLRLIISEFKIKSHPSLSINNAVDKQRTRQQPSNNRDGVVEVGPVESTFLWLIKASAKENGMLTRIAELAKSSCQTSINKIALHRWVQVKRRTMSQRCMMRWSHRIN